MHCSETKKLTKQRLSLLDKSDAELIKVLLSMPMSWSAKNGIAIIDTPIFKIITGTVVTEKEYTFKLNEGTEWVNF
jgi:hypothetical protein